MIVIGYAHDTQAGLLMEAVEGAKQLKIAQIEVASVGNLAGPNDTLHLIADAETWVKIGLAVAALYGAELVKEAAKETWRKRSKIASATGRAVQAPILRIIRTLAAMKNRGTAAVCVRISDEIRSPGVTMISPDRPAGIDITNADVDEIAWRMYLMSKHAATIRDLVLKLVKEGNVKFGVNPDQRTTQVKPLEDGSVEVTYYIDNTHNVMRLPSTK